MFQVDQINRQRFITNRSQRAIERETEPQRPRKDVSRPFFKAFSTDKASPLASLLVGPQNLTLGGKFGIIQIVNSATLL